MPGTGAHYQIAAPCVQPLGSGHLSREIAAGVNRRTAGRWLSRWRHRSGRVRANHVEIPAQTLIRNKGTHMSKTITLVSPYAPPPAQSGKAAAPRAKSSKGIRLGVLDNSKGNADHLLGMIVDA